MRRPAPPCARPAFTLVELMVVVVIITVLIGSVLVASITLVDRARRSNTEAMLAVVQQAIEEFHREQTAHPTASRDRAYRRRYGRYPPDELECFTAKGIPGSTRPRTLAPGGAVMVPSPLAQEGYPPMRFYTQGLPLEARINEFRDQLALTVAITTLGDASAAILQRVEDRYWKDVPDDPRGDPAIYLNRDDDSKWTPGDLRLRYLVDAWGQPVRYLAQRDWKPDDSAPPSSNHPLWNEAATELVRLNGGKPLLYSYGPDGADQLTPDRMGTEGNIEASVLADFEGIGPDNIRHRIDQPWNMDNVYADPTLKEKMEKGIVTAGTP